MIGRDSLVGASAAPSHTPAPSPQSTPRPCIDRNCFCAEVLTLIFLFFGPGMPDPGASGVPIGNAILTLMFDTSGRNRMEWLITSEGTLEAWYVHDGLGERLDNHKLATKEKQPMLGIVRRGDEFLFMLNGEQGAKATLVGVPRTFHVMLYGYGSAENDWDSVLIRAVKRTASLPNSNVETARAAMFSTTKSAHFPGSSVPSS